jgi:hypothetical protein|nr:MAG TPA: hypothetical protein [Caudoviricetes sp.]
MKCLANSATAERLRERVRKETIRFYAIVFCYVLADKYGFGKFKLHQILKTVTNLTEEIIANEVSLEDLNKVLYEDYDVEIK